MSVYWPTAAAAAPPAPSQAVPPSAAPPVDAVDAVDAVAAEREAALAQLFQAQYAGLLRLAVLLGADDAEDIVAEAFYQLYRRWKKLRDADGALPYLRSVVCNLSRMRLRHLQVVRRHADQLVGGVGGAAAGQPAGGRSAEAEALLQDDQRALVAALKELPARQREALVLRYWLGLRESEIAAAMGISCGAVKSHTSRGMAALTRILEERR